MTPSRRGFFATLAALPAVVMGRKAVAAPAQFFAPDGCAPAVAGGFEPTTHTFNIHVMFGDEESVAESVGRAIRQHKGRRLGS